MKQLLQDLSSGEISVQDVPPPSSGGASLLVATRFSLISAGTERAVMEIGRASLVGKARARPDLVRTAVDSVRSEGLLNTYAKVRGRLGQPNALGYSLSGIVLESCAGAAAAPGELVACAGAGKASHAEIVRVPRNLCARVPDGVPAEDAAYATVASIALHGVRLAEVGLGDVAAVIGLGLVGQLTVELLHSAGCVVVGFDPEETRAELARDAGAVASSDVDRFEAQVAAATEGRGADGVLVTAASKTSDPLLTATRVARERAVVCVVGDVKVESPRGPLFAKELKLVVSRSYGPGRYDPTYEENGIDYPPGYVRWTEGRNLQEVLRLMRVGTLRPGRLTSHTFDLDEGRAAYDLLSAPTPSLGILLRYPGRDDAGPASVVNSARPRRRSSERLRVGVIGAGSFARGVLLPSLAPLVDIRLVANATGVSAVGAAKRFGASAATSNADEVVASDDLDAVLIATRHDTHAEYARAALQHGKHVFVEKPLALDQPSLDALAAAAAESDGILMVGFNRRFAPLAVALKDKLGGGAPLAVSYRINAGRLPPSHWTRDPDLGGGRIIGEMCHFIDLAGYLCGGGGELVSAAGVAGGAEPIEETVSATFRYPSGSTAVVLYSALGDASLSKERIEVFSEFGAGVLDDFRTLDVHAGGKRETLQGKRDKGHALEMAAFVRACREGRTPWPLEEMIGVTRLSFAVRGQVLQPPYAGL